MNSEFRVGQGIDIHCFVDGRPLVLGTVTIPSPRGLLGHSDADVLLHAVIDALLGALSWGDIGNWFPNTDVKYKNIASSVLFTEVWTKVRADRWSLVNCDCTLLLEEPKLQPYILPIRTALATLFSVDVSRVSLKATTAEGLGFVGRGEGVYASAVVLLQK